MNRPLISVIIPCYNVEDYIEECLDSVFSQTYKNFEVIAVDNLSNDRTLSILKLYQKKEESLIILDQKRKGAPAARNKGFNFSKGDWIQFLDADDLLLPSKLAHQIDLIDSSLPFIAGSCLWQRTDGCTIDYSVGDYPPFVNLFFTILGDTCSNLWNRIYLEKIGGWDETKKSSQEYWLMFKILKLNDNPLFASQEVIFLIINKNFSSIYNYYFCYSQEYNL